MYRARNMMTKLSGIFVICTLFNAIVSANNYNPDTQRDYQRYENYRQLQQQHWAGTPAAYSYPTQNLQLSYQLGMQPNAASINQQQHQPSTTLRQTWSGAPIIVDYVDDDDDDIVQDIDVERQSVQLAQTAAAAAVDQLASMLHSHKPQTFNAAFVPYKHQLPQQAFHFQAKAAYKNPQTLQSLYSSGPPTPPPSSVSYSRQARLLPFSIEEEAAMNFREQRPWVVKSTSLMDRAPSLVGRERLERFAAYAPVFERYVKKYPRRLVPQYEY